MAQFAKEMSHALIIYKDGPLSMTTSAGNLFKIIFRVSAERVQALPINLQYIYKRLFH